jgi:hypothetical protein
VIKKEAEILKHRELAIELQRMWNVKNKCDTSNNGSNWNHLKSFRNCLSNIPGKHDNK